MEKTRGMAIFRTLHPMESIQGKLPRSRHSNSGICSILRV
ncbi:hypothetical protein DH86_00000880 [Scytalidium sp. 3C]|nr:hypothetical protein DH86_00000880 [Scytalidium sp. 3C]